MSLSLGGDMGMALGIRFLRNTFGDDSPICYVLAREKKMTLADTSICNRRRVYDEQKEAWSQQLGPIWQPP